MFEWLRRGLPSVVPHVHLFESDKLKKMLNSIGRQSWWSTGLIRDLLTPSPVRKKQKSDGDALICKREFEEEIRCLNRNSDEEKWNELEL